MSVTVTISQGRVSVDGVIELDVSTQIAYDLLTALEAKRSELQPATSKVQMAEQLKQLTELYHTRDFDRYYQALEDARQQLRRAMPGFTIVYCEVQDRDYTPAMTHALVPETAE